MKISKSLVLALLLAAAQAVSAQEVTGPPFIAAQGQARAEVVPDIFPLRVTLTETSLDAGTTQKKIEALASQVVGLTKAMKMAEADVTVGNLTIGIEQRFDSRTQEQVFLGNNYTRVVSLRFHDLASLQSFIARLPTGKEVRVATGAFSYSKAETERKKLLKDAMDDARQTADQIAAGLGKKIIGVHNVSDRPMNASYFGNGANAINVMGYSAPSSADDEGSQSDRVLKKGIITLERTIYLIYLLGD